MFPFSVGLSFILFSIFLAYYVNSKTATWGEYFISNDWSNIWGYKKRKTTEGVEVRVLPKGHILAGQKGLFATKVFSQYDIIGEYTGIIREYSETTQNNRYLFTLIDDLVIDAKDHGNELRFVNSHINISSEPNLQPSTCYIDGYPRVFYICIRDIEPGEEMLIDYGDDYNQEFLT